jgi:hypothetical protein
MLFRSAQLVFVLALLLTISFPSKAFAADNAVGNEVTDAANTTLTRTGSGTAAIPYKLQLNLGNANTWTAAQIFNNALTVNGILNLGDGGDAASLSGTTVKVNVGDNIAESFGLQQGTNKYFVVTTTDSSENVSFGNASTNPTFSFLGSGLTTYAGGVTAAGTITASNGFVSNGSATFTPAGTNDVTVTTDSDSSVVVSGLATETGSALCLNGSNELILCSEGGTNSLQSAYDGGNSIATTDARDIDFSLADTATDSNFDIALAADNTVSISRSNNASSEVPAQLFALRNLDNDVAVGTGLVVDSASGGITTALNVSDAEIVTALSSGTNDLVGTNWSIAGSTGNLQTSGDLAVGGGDLTTTAATASLFNTAVTTANIAGAATIVNIGATSGVTTIRNSTVALPNATAFDAISATGLFNSLNVGGGYGSTGVSISNSGNIQANGNLTVDGTGLIAGNTTVGGSFSANAATFMPGGTSDVTFVTDSDSTVTISGLATATGDGLCIDASDNVIKCSGTPSDRRLKQNITPLSEVLPTVLQVQGVRYDKAQDSDVVSGQGRYIGFIAQDLEELFPELVYTDDNGIKSVDYEKMTAVLVESTKEQQKEIDQLKKDVAELKALMNR